MPEAYIIDAVRSPVGRRNGGLADVHPADLGAHSIRALIDRVDVDPAAVDDVVFGCVDTIGPQAGDIARTCWLVAGLPDEVPGTTVDRQCGSSQQAVHFAAQAVMSGTADLVVAGGVQNMSAIPISAAMLAGEQYGFENPFTGSPGWEARYGTQEVSQFRARGDDRREVGHHPRRHGGVRGRVARTRAAGPRRGPLRHARSSRSTALTFDEGPREPNLEKIRSLPHARRRRPAHRRGGVADLRRVGRAADRERRRGADARPEAAGAHPPPLGARRRPGVDAHRADPRDRARARPRPGMTLDDIDLVEINEAFASVVLAWQKETGADLAKVNVNGGAIALGHPLGATGARLMTTLLHELERTGGRYGLQTMCEGGGQANVTIIERL